MGTAIIAMTTVFIGTNIISLIVVTNPLYYGFCQWLMHIIFRRFIWMKVSPDARRALEYVAYDSRLSALLLSTSCRPTVYFIAILVAPVFLELVWKKPLRTVLGATAVNIAAAFCRFSSLLCGTTGGVLALLLILVLRIRLLWQICVICMFLRFHCCKGEYLSIPPS